MTEQPYYFQRSSNPVVSLWRLWKNIIKMWRIKLSGTLILLLIILILLLGSLWIWAVKVEFARSHSFLNVLLLIFFAPALILSVELLGYLSVRRFHPAFGTKSLKILDNGVELEFPDYKQFIDFADIQSLKYNPYGQLVGEVVSWFFLNLRIFSHFLVFYELEVEKEGQKEKIPLPMDIKGIDRAIEMIASKLPQEKVSIGFIGGKPTAAYVPGVTRPELAHQPIGKWVLLILAIFIFVVWFIYRLILP